jgi:hypothetical protein
MEVEPISCIGLPDYANEESRSPDAREAIGMLDGHRMAMSPHGFLQNPCHSFALPTAKVFDKLLIQSK